MLSIAFKNGILMVLIILIVHFWIKKEQIGKEGFSGYISSVSGNSTNSRFGYAPVSTEDARELIQTEEMVKVRESEDQLFDYLFKNESFSKTFPHPGKEEQLFEGVSGYDNVLEYYKL